MAGMTSDDMRLAGRVLEAMRLRDAQVGFVEALQAEAAASPPGRRAALAEAEAKVEELEGRLARTLRRVRIKADTPRELVEMVAEERMNRFGMDEWIERIHGLTGERLGVIWLYRWLAGDPPTSMASADARMRRVLMREDAAAGPGPQRGLERDTGPMAG